VTGILTNGLLDLVRDHQLSFSTILVGNQIADYALALSAGLASLERTHIALCGAPIAALAQRLTAVAETLRLSELVDFVVESCLVGGRDTFANRLYLVDPGVSRVSDLEHRAIRAIEALPGTSCTSPE
jgi:hypothetical protein